MGLAPLLHTLHIPGIPEVIAIRRLAHPLALTGGFAGAAAVGLMLLLLTRRRVGRSDACQRA